MKDYKWDLDELELKKQKLIHEKRKLNNINKILGYEQTIQIYQTLLSEHNVTALIDKSSFKNSEDETMYLEDFFSDIYEEANPFIINFLATNIKLTEEADLKLKYQSRKLLGISNKDLIELVHDIYKTIPNQAIYSQFLKIIDPNNHLLDIEYCPYEYFDYEGICRVDSINHIAYGKVLRSNTLLDIYTLAHEIIHMIVRQNEKPLFLFENRRYYSEYEGQFLNLIVSDYLSKNNYNQDEIRDISILEHQNVTCAIEDAYACTLIKNNLRKNNSIDFKNIASIKKKQGIRLSITEEDYFQYITEGFDSKICNAFSYFIALDLMEIYKKDKEKGLYIFNKLSMLSGNNPKKELESLDINFMSDHSRNFKKYIKQLKKYHN